MLLSVVLFLSACQRGVSQPVQPTSTKALKPIVAARTVTPQSEKAEPTFLALQDQGMLPAFRADLQTLADVPHYLLQVQVDPETAAFQGNMQLEYTNQETVPLDQLFLRLYPNDGASYGAGSLQVTNVVLDGQAVIPMLSASGSILEIELPASLQPGGQAVLELSFQGQVPRDFAGEELGAYGIYNIAQQVLVLSGWYPILAVYDGSGWNLDRVNPVGDAVYSDMAIYQVQVRLPSAYNLAATGVRVDSQLTGGNTIYTYVSGPAREFTLAASPRFGTLSIDEAGVQVNVYFLDEAKPAGESVLKVAVGALKTFNQMFGLYPYAELDIVQVPLHNAGGVEFPGIVFIESERFLDFTNGVAITTVAHEVAHQWWYNLVGSDVIDEPWVDEALASYSSILYWEAVQGSEAYNQVVADFQARYDQAVQKGLAGQITQGMDFYGLPEHAPAYGAIVYMKGALFFHALRQEIGDQAFFTALQQYYQAQRYQIATGDDLLAKFEDTAGRSLDDFYQIWLYGGN